MDKDSKLAIILGCTLGGVALIFIVVLILVCVCSRRHRGDEDKKTSSNVVVTEESNFSIQRSGLPPVQQSPFIRAGSQQWKSNISLTSPHPGGLVTDLKQSSDLSHQAPVNNQAQIIPWYMRTLGRARQFLQRPVAYQSKRDSGEQLVESGYSANVHGNSASSSNVANKRIEIPRVDKHSIDRVQAPKPSSYLQHGSQTELVPNEYIAPNFDNRNYVKNISHINQAYPYSTESPSPHLNKLGLGRPVAASRQNYIDQTQHKSSDISSRESDPYNRNKTSDFTDGASTQLALPRPTVITRDEPSPVAQGQPHPAQTSNWKHPTRPDTPQFDPHRKNAVNPGNHIQKSNQQQSATNQHAGPSNLAISSTEEKKIGDAFRFLDEMDS